MSLLRIGYFLAILLLVSTVSPSVAEAGVFRYKSDFNNLGGNSAVYFFEDHFPSWQAAFVNGTDDPVITEPTQYIFTEDIQGFQTSGSLDWAAGEGSSGKISFDANTSTATVNPVGGLAIGGQVFGTNDTIVIRAETSDTQFNIDNIKVTLSNDSVINLGSLVGDSNAEYVGLTDNRLTQGFELSYETDFQVDPDSRWGLPNFTVYVGEGAESPSLGVSSFHSTVDGFSWAPAGGGLAQHGPGCTDQNDSNTCPYWDYLNRSAFVDDKGRLHLNMVYDDGLIDWTNTGVYLRNDDLSGDDSLGYGTYIFGVASDHTKFDDDAVLGMFTFDRDQDEVKNEIDIELTRSFEQDSNDDTYYTVVTPPNTGTNNNPFVSTAVGSAAEGTTHIFEWSEDGIRFRSYNGLIEGYGRNSSIDPALIDIDNFNGLEAYAAYDYPIDPNERDPNSHLASGIGQLCDSVDGTSGPAGSVAEQILCIPNEGTEKLLVNFWMNNGSDPSDGALKEAIIDHVVFLEMPPIGNSSFSRGESSWTSEGAGTFVVAVDPKNPLNSLGLLTAGSPIEISQQVSTLDRSMTLAFDYQFLSLSGFLEVFLNGILVDTLVAPDQLVDGLIRHFISILDPVFFNLNDIELTFRFDGNTGDQFLIDDIAIYGQTAENSVPAPGALLLLFVGLLGMGLNTKRSR